MLNETSVIVTLVLTGGPGGGKTTALTSLEEAARDIGWNTIVLEEPATAYFTDHAGSKERFIKACAELDLEVMLEVEVAITARSLNALSNALVKSREAGGRWLILLDRGIPDNRAYLPGGTLGDTLYKIIINQHGFANPKDVLGLYSAVIKMTTAANGAEQSYTCENNNKRHESIQEARSLDLLFETVYADHPQYYEIDNSTGFEKKIARAVERLRTILFSALAAA